MYSLFKKEISSFFSSLIGYIVIIVFLLANSFFLWIFPNTSGDFNILESGYANLDSLFIMAPFIFLFLVPALTMRLFADEKKSGTIELLLTRPLSDLKIIMAKYLAGLTLVLFSLIPSLIYFISIYLLANPVGNVDTGGIWGSYIGLFFLAAVYVSIGIFSSSLTENQIVAFIISMFVSFFIYIGFDSISTLDFVKPIDYIIVNIGINEHYKSISRGVIDTRDIVYFITTIALFMFMTKIVLESRKWKK